MANAIVAIHDEDRQRQINAWDDYVAAMNRCNQTRKFEDGKVAAIAWRRFLELFSAPENK